ELLRERLIVLGVDQANLATIGDRLAKRVVQVAQGGEGVAVNDLVLRCGAVVPRRVVLARFVAVRASPLTAGHGSLALKSFPRFDAAFLRDGPRPLTLQSVRREVNKSSTGASPPETGRRSPERAPRASQAMSRLLKLPSFTLALFILWHL